jgi:hypothetical protein
VDPKWGKMRKAALKLVFPAVIIVHLAALLVTFQVAFAQAITNTPICRTDPITGNIDCGAGSDFFWLAGIGLASVVPLVIYAYWRSRRD